MNELHWQTCYEVQLIPDATSTSVDTDKVNFRNVNDHLFSLPRKKRSEQKYFTQAISIRCKTKNALILARQQIYLLIVSNNFFDFQLMIEL